MIRFLSSTRLAVALCLVLAAEGIAGSLLYGGNTAFDRQESAVNIFRSPLFLVPAGLLLLNILFCAGTRLPSMSPRRLRMWTFAGIHMGLVLLAAGLFLDGLFGFVGTKYYFVGVPGSGYFNWRTGREETLPFSLEVVRAETLFHPVNLQIGVKDPEGVEVGVFTVREGVSFTAGKSGIAVTPRKFEIGTGILLLDIRADGRTASGLRARVDAPAVTGGYSVAPVAYKDPEPSDYVALVRFSPPGGQPEEREIRINRPARYGNRSFCIVAMGEDPYRNPYVGLQITREPGERFFWAGAILFGICLCAHLFAKRAGRGLSDLAEGRADKPDGVPVPGKKAGRAMILALAGGVCLLCGPGEGQAGGRVIFGEETWEGVVRVERPVTVEKGGVLRILPGTTVLLSGEDADGDGCREGYIQAFGSLLVQGEAGNPVRFRRLDPGKAWEEVFLKDAGATIRHAVFEGGTWGLHVHGGIVAVEHTAFLRNGGGSKLKGRGASFSRCTFRDNGIGLRFWDGGPTVTSSVIEGNGTGVFYREGEGGGRITGNIIVNREWNLKIGDWARGDLDASGNYWGAKGEGEDVPLVRDFREKKGPGRVVLHPALPRPPEACGAEEGEER